MNISEINQVLVGLGLGLIRKLIRSRAFCFGSPRFVYASARKSVNTANRQRRLRQTSATNE